jgi:hypothetical protein
MNSSYQSARGSLSPVKQRYVGMYTHDLDPKHGCTLMDRYLGRSG